MNRSDRVLLHTWGRALLSMVWGVFLGLSLLGCSTAQKKKNLTKAKYHLEMGVSYLKHNHLTKALNSVLKSVALNPQHSQAHNTLGTIYVYLKQQRKALKHFRMSVELDPKNTSARSNLGAFYVNSHKFQKALPHLKAALQDLTYDRPDTVWVQFGKIYFYKQEYPKAFRAFNKASGFNPMSCSVYKWRARSLYKLKRYTQSAGVFGKLIPICKGLVAAEVIEEATYYKGLALYKSGKRMQALKSFRQVASMNPRGSFASRAHRMLKQGVEEH